MKNTGRKVKLKDDNWEVEALQEAERAMLKNIAKPVRGAILKVAGEIIEMAMNDVGTDIFFDLLYSSKRRVADPLDMHLDVALESGTDPSPQWRFNLRESLKCPLEICSKNGECSKELALIAKSLRKLADEIDAVLLERKSSDG